MRRDIKLSPLIIKDNDSIFFNGIIINFTTIIIKSVSECEP